MPGPEFFRSLFSPCGTTESAVTVHESIENLKGLLLP
jgi:hypothetical protein